MGDLDPVLAVAPVESDASQSLLVVCSRSGEVFGVLLMSHRTEVGGVYAGPVMAGMVNLEALRDLSHTVFVGESVGVNRLALRYAKLPVSIAGADVSSPIPALAALVYLAPEANSRLDWLASPTHAAALWSARRVASSPVGSLYWMKRARSGSNWPFLNLSARLFARERERSSPFSLAFQSSASRISFLVADWSTYLKNTELSLGNSIFEKKEGVESGVGWPD
jgi:hypothetical protein